jgi:hypothetical protein
MPGDFVVLAITDAHVGAGPLGYVIAVTDDNVVIVHCTPDDAERDYAGSSLQQHSGTVTKSTRQRAMRHVQRICKPSEDNFMTHQRVGVWTFVHIFLGDIFMTHWGCGHLSTSFGGHLYDSPAGGDVDICPHLFGG